MNRSCGSGCPTGLVVERGLEASVARSDEEAESWEARGEAALERGEAAALERREAAALERGDAAALERGEAAAVLGREDGGARLVRGDGAVAERGDERGDERCEGERSASRLSVVRSGASDSPRGACSSDRRGERLELRGELWWLRGELRGERRLHDVLCRRSLDVKACRLRQASSRVGGFDRLTQLGHRRAAGSACDVPKRVGGERHYDR